MRLLIVEDEKSLREQIEQIVVSEKYACDTAGDGREGLFLGSEYDYDLAIIDLGLPLLDGTQLIKQLRAKDRNFPILILTARGNWQDKVEGLEAGADDYVVKPFQFEELDARLNALLRRSSGFTQSTIVAGPLLLDLNRKQATLDEQPLA